MIHRIVKRIRKKLFVRKKKLEITKKFKLLKEHRKLSKEQKREIQNFYMDVIGEKIP